MSYKINLCVFQTNPNAFFHMVEQTCLTKGHWSENINTCGSCSCGASLNPEYYESGRRAEQREKQLSSFSCKNQKGRKLEIKFIEEKDKSMKANMIIS
ncbi:hypothetical protein FIBSPDRAFT_872009 [Athelia psychrophila]|uniref:Uncharacterized protein n=1 Tax=Athelia psychrophila TaxID=1759441 RepID=A0A165ZVX6_9AGAM|nr:hypothetical protein FIBSPDRAFT_872009 [Fibularhizoctonia sp. CBS 109695]